MSDYTPLSGNLQQSPPAYQPGLPDNSDRTNGVGPGKSSNRKSSFQYLHGRFRRL